MQTVIHVAESFGGGVSDAISSYATNTPELEHKLLYTKRSATPIDSKVLTKFSFSRQLGDGFFSRIIEIRKYARANPQAVFHAHSSWAGLLTRLATSKFKTPIIYTPHCYAFERTDVGMVTRFAFWVVELMLSLNTTVVAGCSPRESSLANRLGSRSVYVPNVASAEFLDYSQNTFDSTKVQRRKFIAIGRLTPQKGPEYFLEVVKLMQSEEPDAKFIWIGDGDPSHRSQLESNGVAVTGWISKSEIMAEISDSTACIHSAAWEGFPVSILETISLGVPVFARDIKPLQGFTALRLFESPRALSNAIANSNPSGFARILQAQKEMVASEFSNEVQAQRLLEVYSSSTQNRKKGRAHI